MTKLFVKVANYSKLFTFRTNIRFQPAIPVSAIVIAGVAIQVAQGLLADAHICDGL